MEYPEILQDLYYKLHKDELIKNEDRRYGRPCFLVKVTTSHELISKARSHAQSNFVDNGKSAWMYAYRDLTMLKKWADAFNEYENTKVEYAMIESGELYKHKDTTIKIEIDYDDSIFVSQKIEKKELSCVIRNGVLIKSDVLDEFCQTVLSAMREKAAEFQGEIYCMIEHYTTSRIVREAHEKIKIDLFKNRKKIGSVYIEGWKHREDLDR